MSGTSRSAFDGHRRWTFFGDLRCPHCQGSLNPRDPEDLGNGELHLVCPHCHRTVFRREWY
jgi:hypothetical protein